MHGNVWEWCLDEIEGGSVRMLLRGGSWNIFGSYCDAANRNRLAPTLRRDFNGVRLARVPVQMHS
jgi:formylglycine-generating enzyme required for sulfatase activity